MSSERQQINSNAGIHHTLSRQILGIDWYDTESSARRVIEWLAEGQEPVGYVVEKRTGSLTALSGVIRASAILEDFVTDGTPLYAAPVSEAKAHGNYAPDSDAAALAGRHTLATVVLNYDSTETGLCRVYYRHLRDLFAYQMTQRGQFALFLCTRDGEPIHEVDYKQVDQLPRNYPEFVLWATDNNLVA